MALHMRVNSARKAGFDLMASACCSAKACSWDWNTESWVSTERKWICRREAPCVAYELETEVRFWKAERPTPRRVDIVGFERGFWLEVCGLDFVRP